MSADLPPREALEHEERAHELLELGGHRTLRFVPLLAAILAVLAGLFSLYGGRLSEHMLTLKNEAVLNEVSASDLWSEYQAESLKAHLYEIESQTQHGALGTSMRVIAAHYRAAQVPLKNEARKHEAARDQALLESNDVERRKLHFDGAVALLEVAIVLTSVAALTRRSWLLTLAALGGMAALVIGALGLIGAA
ncbi:MAG: DUF4337 domain-containing protein [Candidatus Eremiobacteraeota bacterium]|nr:DUF4337 domain-containing protein [Candidatus Eremiobacteraeota bacterium]